MRISDWSSDVCSSDLAALGAKLFQRSSRRVHLTDSGSRFLPHARQIMQDYNLAAQAVAGVKPESLLRVGVLTSFPAMLLERIVTIDRKSVVWGKRVSVRVDLGGGRIIQKKNIQ